MSILKILDELALTSSRIEKENILLRERENVMLQRVIVAALNPYINYWQKKIPAYSLNTGIITLAQALERLDYIARRMTTGNDAVAHLADTLKMCSIIDAEVIARIVLHDLRCGVGVSTVNNVWPGLIPTFDVMLAHKDTSGIKYPAIAQCLSGNWEVEDDCGIKHKIADVVENRLKLNIKTYDNEKVIYSPITGWFDNGVGDDWIEITVETDDGEVKTLNLLTKEHKLFINGKFSTVESCRIGDRLLFIDDI